MKMVCTLYRLLVIKSVYKIDLYSRYKEWELHYLMNKFLGSAQPASIYRNVCVLGLDKLVEVALTRLRPG